MYLSRILLDINLKSTIKLLSSPNFVHGAVEHGFQDKRERNLWRIDKFNNNLYLLVLSSSKPNFDELCKKYSDSESSACIETVDYDKFISNLKNGQKWAFRLCANPARSVKVDGVSRGKVFAHVTREQQLEWLKDKSSKNGFNVEDNLEIIDSRWLSFYKKDSDKKSVKIKTATFEGVLTIVDIEVFKKAMLNGIGRSKAYGCGLLTLAKINNE